MTSTPHQVDTQDFEQQPQEYTPEHAGQFLERIGLGHHACDYLHILIGDMLLELDQFWNNWESPSDSLILVQAVWEEKNSWETS